MKVLCLSCERLADLGGYRLDAGVLVISCSRCGAEMRAVDAPVKGLPPSPDGPLPPPLSAPSRVVTLRAVGPDPAVIAARAAEAAEAGDPFAPPEGRCPKCIAPRRSDELSCNQCGLTFVNFVKHEVVPPPPLDKLWKELLGQWGDADAHDRLLVAAVTQSALPSIARLYQIRLALSPDDPQARRGRDEVLRLATASAAAFVHGRGAAEPHKSGKVGALVFGIVLLVVLSAMLIRQLMAVTSP